MKVLSLIVAAVILAGAVPEAQAKAPRPHTKIPVQTQTPNPVPKSQLISEGAECSGTTCIHHGATWDCSNPSDCHVVKN